MTKKNFFDCLSLDFENFSLRHLKGPCKKRELPETSLSIKIGATMKKLSWFQKNKNKINKKRTAHTMSKPIYTSLHSDSKIRKFGYTIITMMMFLMYFLNFTLLAKKRK